LGGSSNDPLEYRNDHQIVTIVLLLSFGLVMMLRPTEDVLRVAGLRAAVSQCQ
jgi:hypothetical protein